MNNNWNLEKLERQARGSQDYDDFILKQSGVLDYPDLHVLDIGCSNGYKTKMLFDAYSNITYIKGIDIDENAIKEAQELFQNNPRYNFMLQSLNDLDDEQYDIIHLSYVLQHLKNPEEVLSNLKSKLTDRGIILIKVPDDSFKFCYPDPDDLLFKIFRLYERDIMPKQNITQYTDRYIGKKIFSYLTHANYQNIQLYHSITDTINKTVEEKIKLFTSSIAFRSANDKYDINISVKEEMNNLMEALKEKFKQEDFYYTMTVLYYVAHK